jgi:ribosome-associated toxin RatA of RatAB toxin-antitoxin module
MRNVNRSALVPYTAREMFVIVDDVAAYPEFLGWCKSATVHDRTDEMVQATLELQKGSMSNKFTTRNDRIEFDSIEISLVGGPFRHLQGVWTFVDLGDEGSKVALKLDFEFESMLVDMMFGAFFEQTCNSLVDGFTGRARQIFGDR